MLKSENVLAKELIKCERKTLFNNEWNNKRKQRTDRNIDGSKK